MSSCIELIASSILISNLVRALGSNSIRVELNIVHLTFSSVESSTAGLHVDYQLAVLEMVVFMRG
jgi:hypothetical protein